MATTLLMGQPGAGKTSYAIERILLPYFSPDPTRWDKSSNELGEGIIVTNIPVARDRWIEEFGEEAVAERLHVFPEFIVDPETGEERRPFTRWEDFAPFLELRDKHGRAPLFAIDEGHEVIPKGMRFTIDKQTGQRHDTFPNKLLVLFTRQRHYLASFVLITQDPFSMAPDILKQVHSTLYIENAEMKGNARAYTTKIWNKAPPRNFADVPFAKCDDGEAKPRAYSAEAQAFFISNSKNKEAANGGRKLEGRYRHARPIWKRPIMLIMIPAFLALLWFGSDIMSIGRPAEAQITVKRPGNGPQSAKAGPEAPKGPDETKLTPADVVADLRTVEGAAAVNDKRVAEASYPLQLFAPNWKLPGKPAGPVVVVGYPTGWAYASLAEYASYWGYAIQPAACGWTLTRSDSTRHLYDSTCLARIHHASNDPAAPKPAAVDAKPVVRPAGLAPTRAF